MANGDDEPLLDVGGRVHPRVLEALRNRLYNVGQGMAAGAKEDVGAVVQPLLNLVFGPQSVRANWDRGYAGDMPTVEEQIPWAAETAKNVIGMGSPFSLAGAAGSAGGRLTTPEGFAIKGKEFSKKSSETLKGIEAGPKGAGPMDLGADVEWLPPEQAALERYVPARGVSPRMRDAIENQDVINGVSDSIAKGIQLGAHKWYDTSALRDEFRKAYRGSNSDPGGERAFRQFIDLIAATSPRSDVPTNIRNASFYHYLQQQGLDLPEKLPYPYGHVAQNLHRQNFATLSAAGLNPEEGLTKTLWDIFQNPKPASFAENLMGNLEPVTVDTHAFRNIGMRTGDPRFLETSLRAVLKDEWLENPNKQSLISKYGELSKDAKGRTIVTFRPQQLYRDNKLTLDEAKRIPMFWASKPNENEYAAAEEFYKRLAAKHGLRPAEAQAAAWAGGGDLTGLGSPPSKTFQQMLNERALYTAQMRGEKPKATLRAAIRGEKPLLGIAGAGIALPGLLNQPPEQY